MTPLRQRMFIVLISGALALTFFSLPFSYTYLASTYFLGAHIIAPSVQLLTWDSTPFSAQTWKNATDLQGRTTRGAMVKDLLRTTDFSRMTNEDVIALLGTPNGYLNYDHIVSYVVQQGNTTYMLGFSNGNVLLQQW